MPASGESKCKTCGALILWVTMVPTGKPCPLNAVPKASGNIERKPGRTNPDKFYGRVVPRDERRLLGKLYITHFASCKQADMWRGGAR